MERGKHTHKQGRESVEMRAVACRQRAQLGVWREQGFAGAAELLTELTGRAEEGEHAPLP
jgi:hypothetical protein